MRLRAALQGRSVSSSIYPSYWSTLYWHVRAVPEEADDRCPFYTADRGLAARVVAAGGALRGVRPGRLATAVAALPCGAGRRRQSDQLASGPARALAGLWWDGDRQSGGQDQSRHQADCALGFVGRGLRWAVCASRASP